MKINAWQGVNKITKGGVQQSLQAPKPTGFRRVLSSCAAPRGYRVGTTHAGAVPECVGCRGDGASTDPIAACSPHGSLKRPGVEVNESNRDFSPTTAIF